MWLASVVGGAGIGSSDVKDALIGRVLVPPRLFGSASYSPVVSFSSRGMVRVREGDAMQTGSVKFWYFTLYCKILYIYQFI